MSPRIRSWSAVALLAFVMFATDDRLGACTLGVFTLGTFAGLLLSFAIPERT